MSAHKLTIAKASLTATFLRPGTIPTSKEELAELHNLLNNVLMRCTRQDIQKCKRWLLRFCIDSQPRVDALVKYLNALSDSMSLEDKDNISTSKPTAPPRKRRLHLLYLIHDVLYHIKHRELPPSSKFELLVHSWQPAISYIFPSTTSNERRPKHQKLLDNLLQLWETSGLFERSFVVNLRRELNAASKGVEIAESTDQPKEPENETAYPISISAPNIPYVLPEMHGDYSTPYFDLPAGTILPHITPHSMKPINPAAVQPIRLKSGPASDTLKSAVEDLLRSVRGVYGQILPGEDHDRDAARPINDQDGYYGWSLDFCQKMKEKKEQNRREASRRSRSSSPGRRKRQRFGSDDRRRESSYDSY